MKRVTIYSQNACASCVMVKKWLTIKKIGYNEINLDEHPDQREYVQRISGSSTVPVVVVENETDGAEIQKSISVGYKPAQLATLIS